MKIKKKTIIIISVLYVVIILTLALLRFKDWEIDFLDDDFQWISYCLGDTNWVQVDSLVQSNDSINFGITIGGEIYKYFGSIALLPNGGKPIDLSQYKNIEIEIESDSSEYATILFVSYCNDDDTIISEKIIKLTSENNSYKYNLEEWSVPQWWWWCKLSETPVEEIPSIDHKQVFAILVGTNKKKSDQDKVSYQFRISRFKLKKDSKDVLVFVGFSLVPLLLFYTLIVIFKRRKKVVFVHSGLQLNRIEKFIGHHYFEKEFTINKVSESLNISKGDIEIFCKKKLGLSFREYVIALRVAQAEKLLKNKQLQIQEIAYQLGYKHVTMFNKDFKRCTGYSPTFYRQNISD